MFAEIFSIVLWAVLPIAIFVVPLGMFNTKLFKGIRCTECSGLVWLHAYLPIANVSFPRIIAYGRAPVYKVLLWVASALLVFRALAVALVAVVPILVFLSAFASLLAIVLFWALYTINAVDFARMFDCGVITYLVCIVVPPLGYYLLSRKVLPYLAHVEDEISGTFDG